MKKILVFLMSLALCLGMLTGCAAAKEEKIIKVAASPTPHAWILKTATEALAEEGWTLEVLEYSAKAVVATRKLGQIIKIEPERIDEIKVAFNLE